MTATDVCPNQEELAEVLAGRAPGSSVAVLRHLEECSVCSALAEKQLLQDDLTRLIQSPTQMADINDTPQVREVLQRLNSWVMTRSITDTQTPASGVPTLTPGSETTQAVHEDEIQRFMPAKSPDELARLAHYRVLKLIGYGGMGAVFLAEDTRLQRRVALKVLRGKRCLDDLHRERFLREARLAAAVRHENVVTIHDVEVFMGPLGDVPYLAMEFLDGESLEQTLRRRGSLSLREAVDVGEQVASALVAAHEQGLIHRDIKPANVFLERIDGLRGDSKTDVTFMTSSNVGPQFSARIKVLDFGLALPLNLSGDGRLTDSGMLVGTPAYMSPEQANAFPLDARTDLFSLGCLLYEAVTGRRPFSADTVAQQLAAVLTVTPVPLREVMREASSITSPTVVSAFDALVMQLLQRDPQLRPSSAIEVRDRLRTLRKQVDASASDSIGSVTRGVNDAQRSTSIPTGNRVKRSPSLTLTVSIGGVIALLLGVAILITRKDGSTTKIEVDAVQSVTISGLDGKPDITGTSPEKPVETPPEAGRKPLPAELNSTTAEPQIKELIQSVRAEMQNLNPQWDANSSFLPRAETNKVIDLTLYTPGLKDLRPLAKLRGLQKLAAFKPRPAWVPNHELPNAVSNIDVLRGLSLTSVILNDFPHLTDLSPLEELPLQHLELYATPLRDPQWLRRFKLKTLNIGGRTTSFDLSVLKEMPLENLSFNESPFDDLSPLRGMMLKSLQIGSTRITDLSPVEGMPLEHLVCVKCPIRDWAPLTKLPKLEVLRADLSLDQLRMLLPHMPALRSINDKSVSEILTAR